MRTDHLIAILFVVAIVAVPALAYAVWRIVKVGSARRAAREMRKGNQVYGAWRNTSQPGLSPRSGPKLPD